MERMVGSNDDAQSFCRAESWPVALSLGFLFFGGSASALEFCHRCSSILHCICTEPRSQMRLGSRGVGRRLTSAVAVRLVLELYRVKGGRDMSVTSVTPWSSISHPLHRK